MIDLKEAQRDPSVLRRIEIGILGADDVESALIFPTADQLFDTHHFVAQFSISAVVQGKTNCPCIKDICRNHGVKILRGKSHVIALEDCKVKLQIVPDDSLVI